LTLSAGSRLGPYEILSAVGAGGMGEIYRAKDTRLDRTVAVKVLPAHLSENAEFRQRFEREAKTISQLSHPHICTLHDVGNQDGVEYLVMEFLEGETLTEKLAKGPLPLEQVLRFGLEIADALEKAHRQGIVHRDLKPGNVMITKTGVKLVDFGLAKLAAAQPGGVLSSFSVLPTQAGENLTAEGTILGTFQYMAPEQLEGRDADSRTDIFALGSVLYEMATGQKAFSGRSQASLIGSILKDEPAPIASAQPMSPPALDRVVKTCLAKDPDDRFQTAHDVKLQLQWIAEGGSAVGLPAPVTARRKSRERLAWILFAGATLVSLLALGALFRAGRREPSRMVQSSVLPPEKTAFGGAMELSPDGLRIAFVARGTAMTNVLWVRPLNAGAAQPLAGTEGAFFPFWSPDSRFLGFFADGKLKKIEASGGPPQTLCDAAIGRGGTWNRDGVILFAPSPGHPISRVSSSGGAASAATELPASGTEGSHLWPLFLPDGKHFLYLALGGGTGTSERDAIFVGALQSKKRQLLFHAGSSVAYASNHLFFHSEQAVLARPFDPKRRRFMGEAIPVAENVRFPGHRKAVFSVSENGVMVYRTGGAGGLSQLAWLDRSGKEIVKVGAPADYREVRLSHEGRRAVLGIDDSRLISDLWLYDLARNTITRFTFDQASDFSPVWSPDDRKIAFASGRTGPADLYLKDATGTAKEEPLLLSGLFKASNDWSRDGRFLAFASRSPKTGSDLWIFSVADRKASPFLQTEFEETSGRFSPDGRFVAYVSNESGRDEVYVQRFPVPGGKWQISTTGGAQPLWAHSGRELFYLSPPSKLMAVEVRAGEAFEAGIPTLLFEHRFAGGPGRKYDVSSDSQRFLAITPIGEETPSPITLVVNWTAEIKP